jgi:hypothetical protein
VGRDALNGASARGAWRAESALVSVLPTRKANGHAGQRVRLRCVTSPDAAQKVLLNRLGIQLPARLRRLGDPMEM